MEIVVSLELVVRNIKVGINGVRLVLAKISIIRAMILGIKLLIIVTHFATVFIDLLTYLKKVNFLCNYSYFFSSRKRQLL